MCGIAGFLRTSSPSAGKDVLVQMGNVIRHRGPDAGGEYLDDYVSLAHRRLSIIDLSAQGNQPMFSSDGRKVIVFNGEIYNFQELKKDLQQEGIQFNTRTDTEVILALYEKYGADCLPHLNGMFAFALWDMDKKQLFLARDRIGKKPLYYYHGGDDRLAFASELKALLQLPGLDFKIEPTSVADYLKYHYIPSPKTIYQQIYKLSPGHCLTLSMGQKPVISEYWDVCFQKSQISLDDAQEQLYDLLQHSTAQRMIADVPLGAFLSGGVDSSAIVALMAKTSSQPVKTCTIGFDDKKFDESPFAREVAELFATDHKEYRVTTHLEDTIKLLPKYFDEPFADSSAVPTYHVSQLARQAVTVALAGDGGDESFGGYQKYAVELKEDIVRNNVPQPLLTMLHGLSKGWSHPLPRKLHSLTGSALSEPARAFYRTNTYMDDVTLHHILSASLSSACRGYDPAGHTLRHYQKVATADHATRMIYTDLKTYLPDDILVKVDRMSMAHSLEVRAPFLDYRIIEFAASLPSRFKISNSGKKIILRKTFSQFLPQSILNRRKQGFSVPLDHWFRNDLKSYTEKALLHSSSLGDLLSIAAVQKLWQEHQSRKVDHGTILWSLLMLSLWQQEYCP